MDQATKTKVVNSLRARKGDQIAGRFYSSATLGCAVGIMAEILGYTRRNYFLAGRPSDGPTLFLMKQGFGPNTLQTIVAMNDTLGFDFDMIAAWIDRHVKADDNPFTNLMRGDWTTEVEQYANSKAFVNA